jgi:hypothetical protein
MALIFDDAEIRGFLTDSKRERKAYANDTPEQQHKRAENKRAMLADYLQEQDEPALHAFSHFMRVQHAQSILPDWDPRQEGLEADAELLLKRYAWTWFGIYYIDPSKYPYADMTAFIGADSLYTFSDLGITSMEFRNGFPDTIHISTANFVKNAEKIFERFPTVTGLNTMLQASDSEPVSQDTQRLINCPFLSRIKKLQVGLLAPEGHLNPDTTTGIPLVVPHEDMAALLRSPRLKPLESLSLLCRDLDDVSANKTMAALFSADRPLLRSLAIEEDGGFTSDKALRAGRDAMRASGHRWQLESLKLAYIDDSGLDAVLDMPLGQIQFLDLHCGGSGRQALSDAAIGRLCNSSMASTLRQLRLARAMDGTMSGMTFLCEPGKLPNLEALTLAFMDSSVEDARTLAASDLLSKLKYLSFDSYQHEAISVLLRSEKPEQLEVLSLRSPLRMVNDEFTRALDPEHFRLLTSNKAFKKLRKVDASFGDEVEHFLIDSRLKHLEWSAAPSTTTIPDSMRAAAESRHVPR